MIHHKYFALILLALLIVGCAGSVFAQDKYEVRQVKFNVYDKSGYPWNDANAFLGVRLDNAKKDTLDDQELAAGTLSYTVGGDYQRYALKFDSAGGCYADVSFIVYKQLDKTINYELTLLQKDGDKYISVPLATRAISVSRSTPDKYPLNASIFRPMLTNDWLLYGGIMLASALFIYFVMFRWLFSILLFNNNWPVSRAEYFTTSISLMLLIGVFGLLLALFLPHTIVMYTILILLSVFWAGHAVVWALS